MKKRILVISAALFILLTVVVYFRHNGDVLRTDIGEENLGGNLLGELHSLSIESLRQGEYPGSDLVVEQKLDPGSNYDRFIVSYRSEGLKIYALLTIPQGDNPEAGWPAIVFNHGYIPPAEYRTTERYIAYTDAFSRNGYVLLRPDYRGHGNSEGEPSGAYGSNGYTIDVLNALSSLKKHKDVNPQKIGFWGHSMGGFIALRSMVVSKDVKVGVIWAGVVGSYEDLFERWRRRNVPSGTPNTRGGSWRQALSERFGSPADNPSFWSSLSANSFLKDISGPVQIHHGTNDTSVPYEFSQKLSDQLEQEGKEVELYLYEGDDHNISANFNTATQRSVEYFDRYLK